MIADGITISRILFSLILLAQDGIQYQIYLDSEGNPVEASDRDVVQKCREEIDLLFAKARSMWSLE